MVQNGVSGAELSVETGPLAGMRFLMDRPLISIGRSEDNDISLEDPMVSKNHCRIITQGDNFLVEDLGSSNGTVVNGQQINTYMLQDGDKLFLGDTTLTFRKNAATQGVAAATPAEEGRNRKWVWITVGIVSGLVLIATAVVLVLVFVVLPERDSIAPNVTINRPSPSDAFLIAMPVPNGTDVPIDVTSSDDKGLDRVEILADNSSTPVKVFKASTSRRESPGSGQKTEKFSMTWHANGVGQHTIKATGYDWKGNVSTTESVQFKVDLDQAANNAHAYCQQIDQKIAEYNAYKEKFGSVYSAASKNTTSAQWLLTGNAFNEIRNERQQLMDSLDSMSPPAQFAESHTAFKATVQSAQSADEAAIKWAAAMNYATDPYYSYYYPESSTTAAGYKNQVDGYSTSAQGNAATFNKINISEREGQLAIQPPIARLD